MADILGPIIAIVLMFGLWYAAQIFDTAGERKILKEESLKINATSELREKEIKLFELQLERERLHNNQKALPSKNVETEYKFLEDQSEE